jgi:hypothetical protein
MLYKIQHNLKLYTWGSCLATGGVTLRLALNSSMVAAATVLAGIYILGIATAGQEANIAFSKKEPTTKHTGIPSSSEQSETGTSYHRGV